MCCLCSRIAVNAVLQSLFAIKCLNVFISIQFQVFKCHNFCSSVSHCFFPIMSKKSQTFGSPFNLNARNELKTPKRKSNLLAPQSRATYPSRLFTTHSNSSTNASAQPMCSHNNNNNKSQTHGIPQQQHHCQLHHSFISDITDVRQMENTLLQLLDDFHSGKLQAFGQDITFEKMESVREQQETLAKLHFDLNLQQEVYGHQTEEGRRMAKDNMSKLIENLQQLSNSIEQLQSRSSSNSGS